MQKKKRYGPHRWRFMNAESFIILLVLLPLTIWSIYAMLFHSEYPISLTDSRLFMYPFRWTDS
jgi:succinate dehydrogenase hydrophobic anchor subunit